MRYFTTSRPRGTGFRMEHTVKPGAHSIDARNVRNQLAGIAELERTTRHTQSDPFYFNRLRAHAKRGLIEVI